MRTITFWSMDAEAAQSCGLYSRAQNGTLRRSITLKIIDFSPTDSTMSVEHRLNRALDQTGPGERFKAFNEFIQGRGGLPIVRKCTCALPQQVCINTRHRSAQTLD